MTRNDLFKLIIILIGLITVGVFTAQSMVQLNDHTINIGHELPNLSAFVGLLLALSLLLALYLLNENDRVNNASMLVTTIKTQRHDFSHHLQTIYGLLEIGEFEKAKKYIEDYVGQVSVVTEAIKIKHKELGALIIVKSNIARNSGLKFDAEIEGTLENIPLTDSELVTIIGNLLDNAIYAAITGDVEPHKVKLLVIDREEYVGISVANTGAPISNINMRMIFKPGFTLKIAGSGLGLFSVKQIVKNHYGSIRVTQDDMTLFEIQIPKSRAGVNYSRL